MLLHVIDANCSWIRSLVDGLPSCWQVRNYRIYSPQWFPGGKADLLRCFRAVKLDRRSDEVYVAVPGWNRAPRFSAFILETTIQLSLRNRQSQSAILFTFPFYSGVAKRIRAYDPSIPLIYHSHDPFEYYAYPKGYIRKHEDRLVPLCNKVLTISDDLSHDFKERYPESDIQTLGNGVAESFITQQPSKDAVDHLETIKRMGRPVVGCVGQINSSYDWDLLEKAASTNPQTQFVFIGQLFEEGASTTRIREYFTKQNVHWLGPKPHSELQSWMSNADILLCPLAINEQNNRRDTLRLYDYLTTSKAIFSTPIACAFKHKGHVQVFSDYTKLITSLGIIPGELTAVELSERRHYILQFTWAARGRSLAEIFESLML